MPSSAAAGMRANARPLRILGRSSVAVSVGATSCARHRPLQCSRNSPGFCVDGQNVVQRRILHDWKRQRALDRGGNVVEADLIVQIPRDGGLIGRVHRGAGRAADARSLLRQRKAGERSLVNFCEIEVPAREQIERGRGIVQPRGIRHGRAGSGCAYPARRAAPSRRRRQIRRASG